MFNKLTKGGTEQGIYIEDGKVYINAKYILAGSLAGERINGRGLKVIDDDQNVTLEIDSKGNVILAPKTFCKYLLLRPLNHMDQYWEGDRCLLCLPA